MIRAIFLFAKSLKRIADSLEMLAKLYARDLEERGILIYDPKVKDTVEITYSSKEPDPEDDFT